LRELLSGLEERGFWEGGEKELRERIFREVLRRAGDFFGDFSPGPGTTEKRSLPGAEGHFHGEAYDALASKLGSLSGLKSRITGILAYPTPYCYPYFYQADLILPEGLSVQDLADLANLIRGEFKGREFEAEGRRFSITLVPERVSRAPDAFMGTPFPFLPEHIRRYGRTLFGPEPPAMKEPALREDLVEWCRIFFPFFAYNLGRRVEHSSRTLNFCQMAAVRLFLETGDVVTDALSVRDRHREVFGDGSPPDDLWDYLLRDKPGRRDRGLYRPAASRLRAELEAVEGMLDVPEGHRPSGPGKESLRR